MNLDDAIVIISSLDSNGKEQAAKALGEMGPAASPAIPALMDSLLFWYSDGPFGEASGLCVWWSGAEALGKIGEVAVKALIDRLNDRNMTSDRRWSAAWALGAIGSPLADVALPALQSCKTDRDPRVKRHASNAETRIIKKLRSRAKGKAKEKVRRN